MKKMKQRLLWYIFVVLMVLWVLPVQASAEETEDETYIIDSEQEGIRPEEDIVMVTVGSVITEAGIYQLTSDANDGVVTIDTTEDVVLMGTSNGKNDYLTIKCAQAGTHLTIENLKIDSATEKTTNAITFTGTGNRLTVKGENYLGQCFQNGPFSAIIEVPGDAELKIDGDGVLYIYKHAYNAAAIGGNDSEASGKIEFAGPTVLIYGTMATKSPVIGSSVSAGDIIFSGGEVAVLGGTIHTAGGIVQ